MWDRIHDSKVLREPCGMHSRTFLWRGGGPVPPCLSRPPSPRQSQPADVDVLTLPDHGV